MKTTPPAPEDFAASVLAVPPLARRADLSLDRAANAALIRHLEAGGIRTLMYGGNANFYHVGMYEFGAILDMVAELAAPTTWVIPSIGPDYGKMIDQARAAAPSRSGRRSRRAAWRPGCAASPSAPAGR